MAQNFICKICINQHQIDLESKIKIMNQMNIQYLKLPK